MDIRSGAKSCLAAHIGMWTCIIPGKGLRQICFSVSGSVIALHALFFMKNS